MEEGTEAGRYDLYEIQSHSAVHLLALLFGSPDY